MRRIRGEGRLAREEGSVTVVTAAVLFVLTVIVVGCVDLTQALAAASRAQTTGH